MQSQYIEIILDPHAPSTRLAVGAQKVMAPLAVVVVIGIGSFLNPGWIRNAQGMLSVFFLVTIAFLPVVLEMYLNATRQSRLVLAPDGLHLPEVVSPSLQMRYHRAWDDVRSIDLVTRNIHDIGQDLNSRLTITFKSGGVAHIWLRNIAQQDLGLFFRAVTEWGDRSKLSLNAMNLERSILGLSSF